jgi:hypothetical protein
LQKGTNLQICGRNTEGKKINKINPKTKKITTARKNTNMTKNKNKETLRSINTIRTKIIISMTTNYINQTEQTQ